ncbi:MAG: hypothetical protein ACK5RS_07550 [Acidobacteriota bacterium]
MQGLSVFSAAARQRRRAGRVIGLAGPTSRAETSLPIGRRVEALIDLLIAPLLDPLLV